MTHKNIKKIVKIILIFLIFIMFLIQCGSSACQITVLAKVRPSSEAYNFTEILSSTSAGNSTTTATNNNNNNNNNNNSEAVKKSLYAKYAAVVDASNSRVLLGKNENEQVPMASTTKIMTCIIALENADTSFTCTTSKYAASMPDVQLNAKKGENFTLNDLLYSLMLKSHNDSAVIIAENVAYQYIYNNLNNLSAETLSQFDFINKTTLDSSFLSEISTEQSKKLVDFFAGLMNQKAKELGCINTYFITPNGLDGADENGIHSTTAKELCIIMSYCIKNPEFLKITQAKSHSFNGYSVSNANAFLNMYPDIISGKTGFTGDAGYCYVCAYQKDGRTFIVALLACGWPNNKTYKWHDSKILLNWARDNFYQTEIIKTGYLSKDIPVLNGETDSVHISSKESLSMLLSESENVNVTINIPESLEAPVNAGQQAGNLSVYINDSLYRTIPIYTDEGVIKTDFLYFLKIVVSRFLFG